MTLTEVTTDFTSGAAPGSYLFPGVHGWEFGCLLGNPGALPSSCPVGPLPAGSQATPASPQPQPLAEPGGEKPSEASKGLTLFWETFLLTIALRSIACSPHVRGEQTIPSPWEVGGVWVVDGWGLLVLLGKASLSFPAFPPLRRDAASLYDGVCVSFLDSRKGRTRLTDGRGRVWLSKRAIATHPAPQLSLQNPHPCSQCRQASGLCWMQEVAAGLPIPRPDWDSLSGRPQAVL